MSMERNWVIIMGSHLIPGLVLVVVGMTMMWVTISSSIRIGKGTLAPWSPTKKLVVVGLYRYVRNPMILGVLITLLAEATCVWSALLLRWSGLFFIINMIYFVLYEEPVLENRFGEDYRQYKEQVPRWIPRFTPFKSSGKK